MNLFIRLPITALIGAALLSGCTGVAWDPFPTSTPTPPQPTTDEWVTQPLPDEGSPTEMPLEPSPQDHLANAEELLRSARSAPAGERDRLELAAAWALLAAGRSGQAQALVERMEPATLPPPLAADYWLVQARLALQGGNAQRAADFATRATRQAGVSPERLSSAWALKASAHQAAGEPVAAVEALIARDRYITRDDEQVANRHQIYALVRGIDPMMLNTLRGAAREPVLIGWLDLVLAEQRAGADSFRRDLEVQDWARRHRGHPAEEMLSASRLGAPGFEARPVGRIALLLPLSSDFGAAARAVHDGFLAVHNASSNPDRPRVSVYDIGAETFLIADFYRQAVADGADLVVGPLGRDAVDALITSTDLTAPTLLLGEPTGPVFSEAPVYRFGLLPEHDAQAVAHRAWADGHRVAAVLHPADDWGQRIVDAFTREWTERGGVLARSQTFHAGQTDYALPIRRLLSIDTSEARRDRIANVIGTRPQYDTRRRQDVDFVFLAARSREGRLLKPQINFFQGHDLPVYATSHIYDVRPDPLNDTELNGVSFPDMPWIVARDAYIENMRDALGEGEMPYRNSPLDRLFAFGADAYALAPHLERLRGNPYAQYDGLSSRIRVERDGLVLRDLTWARFEDGRATPLAAPAAAGLRHYKERNDEPTPSIGAAPDTWSTSGTGG